jgi:hypothetical protein
MPQIIVNRDPLYHFTAAHLADSIKAEGLWRGRLPWHRDNEGRPCVIRHMNETRMSQTRLKELDERELEEYRQNIARKRLELKTPGGSVVPIMRRWRRPGFQWLTSNPDWNQPFCLLGALPFPKNAIRFEVRIPITQTGRLNRWSTFCERGRPDCVEEINVKDVDWENWWLFYGPIDPLWLVNCDRNPGPQIVAEIDGKDGKAGT